MRGDRCEQPNCGVEAALVHRRVRVGVVAVPAERPDEVLCLSEGDVERQVVVLRARDGDGGVDLGGDVRVDRVVVVGRIAAVGCAAALAVRLRRRVPLDGLTQAREESVGRPHPLFGPVEVALGLGRLHHEQPRRVRAVLLDYPLGRDDVALRFRHLLAVELNHPLCEQVRERLAVVESFLVGQHLGEKPRVQQVHHRVFDPADVLVDRHPVVRALEVEGGVFEPGRNVSQEVPRGVDERVHRVRLAGGRLATGRTRRLFPLVGRIERVAGRVDERRQLDGKLVVGHEHRPAVVTMNDRDRGPPVALSGDAPVAQLVLGARLGALDVRGQPLACGLAVESAVRSGVDYDAVVGERRLAHVRGLRERLVSGFGGRPVPVVWRGRDHGLDVDAHLRRERVVAFVVSGDGHQRTRPHVREHEVGDEDGNLLIRGRIRRGESGRDAVRFVALRVGLLFDEPTDCVVFCGQLLAYRVVGCERETGRAVDRVDPGGERLDGAVSRHLELQCGPVLAPDPVPLHLSDRGGPPVEVVDGGQQFVGVRGDLEEPLVEFAGLDRCVTPPTQLVVAFDLLVREHGLTRGTPVHLGFAPVDEPRLVELAEQPLIPAIVLWRTGGYLPLPVVAEAHRPHLLAHGVDAVYRPLSWVRIALFGRVLGGQPEGVPSHRVEHVVATHSTVSRVRVGDRVVADVAHVELSGRVRVHPEDVRRVSDVVRRSVHVGVVPRLLPPALDCGVVVSLLRHLLIYSWSGRRRIAFHPVVGPVASPAPAARPDRDPNPSQGIFAPLCHPRVWTARRPSTTPQSRSRS